MGFQRTGREGAGQCSARKPAGSKRRSNLAAYYIRFFNLDE